MHPYRTLDVPLRVTSETIRQAYLDAIRRYPPERDSERFQLVNQAYSAIASEDDRVKREIGFQDESPPFHSPLEAVAAYWQADLQPQPPGEDDFYAFLNA